MSRVLPGGAGSGIGMSTPGPGALNNLDSDSDSVASGGSYGSRPGKGKRKGILKGVGRGPAVGQSRPYERSETPLDPTTLRNTRANAALGNTAGALPIPPRFYRET